MMKDTIGKAISLGLGLAVAGKEQVEKTIDELAKKSELSGTDSGTLKDELIRKGDDARERIETTIRERVNAIVGDKKLVTAEELSRLERRIEALEQRLAADYGQRELPDR